MGAHTCLAILWVAFFFFKLLLLFLLLCFPLHLLLPPRIVTIVIRRSGGNPNAEATCKVLALRASVHTNLNLFRVEVDH